VLSLCGLTWMAKLTRPCFESQPSFCWMSRTRYRVVI
jgi:hypothetical protein